MKARAPAASSPSVRAVMQANRASNTTPERALRSSLRAHGFVGYRLNRQGIPGRPDIAFVSRRIAIFVHGCFWHRCPACALPLPRSNREFWKAKFRRNRERDARKRRELENLGWCVFEVYECWIRDNPQRLPLRIKRALLQASSPK